MRGNRLANLSRPYLTVSTCCECCLPHSLHPSLVPPPSLLLPPFACLIAPTQSNRGNFIRHLRWKKVESSRVASSSTRNLQTEFTRGPQIISNTVPQPPNRGVAGQKRERKRHATRTSTSCLEMYLWLKRAWLGSSYVESWIQQWSLALRGDLLTFPTERSTIEFQWGITIYKTSIL